MSIHLIPYLMMPGNGQEVVRFYEQALDAKVLALQTYGEMPQNPDSPLPAQLNDYVGHAHLKIGESELMLSDSTDESNQAGNRVTICIATDDVEKAKKLFHALQQGGQVNHPFEKTFFSPGFGTVTDKFGVTFQIVTEG
ncbi:VOC family protein [Desmospora activa]|uniref:PhnB protein n=1 Tax=Desmospora activa DSM 45169 TaxID=1121389 RepID=A0A2T4ZCR7_9BACL|nr:VOC family protein [Desmospora activa]PTM59652.1 PhnB protein [Desmospora activa DSM 45169]